MDKNTDVGSKNDATSRTWKQGMETHQMSDQLKPTGECHHDLSERETMCADGWCPICLQAALHDADKQLAAEREEHAKALLAKQTRIEIFQRQLAAEQTNAQAWRLLVKGKEGAYVAMEVELEHAREEIQLRNKMIEQLREQLTAERERFNRDMRDTDEIISQLREQLADLDVANAEYARPFIESNLKLRKELEASLQPLVDALKFYAEGKLMSKVAKDALAKVSL